MSLGWTRLLVALALVLAVPVQGLAAATADLCMALGHHDAAVHTHDGDGGAHQHHGHDSPATDKHCAPCIACCAAAAIALSAPLVIADERADSVVAAGPRALVGIPLDTLDRPPLAR